MRESPFVTIIILNYNCRRFLDICLSALLDTEYSNYEIVLVDNNSEDGSVEFVVQKFGQKRIKVLKLAKNYGFAMGNNIGAKYAYGDYLVFLNPDTKVDPKWLRNLVSVLEANSLIGIAQPKLLQMDSNRIDSTGGFIDHYGLVWSRGYDEEDVGQYDKITEIFYAKGAALIIRRDLWAELGGFDPIFFTYFEETDLCWRAWNMGQKVVYVPKAIVYHAGGGILKHVPHHLKFHEARGRIVLLIKHYSLGDILRYVSILLVLHLFNVFRQLAKRNAIAAVAIIRGTFWCLFNFKRIWMSRKKLEESLDKTAMYNIIISKLLSNKPKIF